MPMRKSLSSCTGSQEETEGGSDHQCELDRCHIDLCRGGDTDDWGEDAFTKPSFPSGSQLYPDSVRK